LITPQQGHPILPTPKPGFTPANASSAFFARARVLIIDPDAEPASQLEPMLLLEGHQIERAFDGAQALASMASGAPDLTFCNIAGFDGCRIVRALKALPGGAQVPVIMLAASGSAGAQDVQLAQFDAGADEVWPLPLAPGTLRLRVRNLLRLTHARRQNESGVAPPAAAATAAAAALAIAVAGAREQERIRLARELHDELGQRLALLKIDLHHLRSFLGPGAIEAWQAVDDGVSALTAQVRTIAGALRPVALDQNGLEAALEKLLQRQFGHGATQYVFEYAGLPLALAPAIDSALYRMVQECVTNIVRHAGATRVVVELNGGASGCELELIVRDNGCGFDAGIIHASNGLRGIRERVQLLGGSFFLESSAQRGTRIAVHLPLK
jgi:signal transduction histidine kinase